MRKLLKKIKKSLKYQTKTEKSIKKMKKSFYNRRYYLQNSDSIKKKRRERYKITGF